MAPPPERIGSLREAHGDGQYRDVNVRRRHDGRETSVSEPARATVAKVTGASRKTSKSTNKLVIADKLDQETSPKQLAVNNLKRNSFRTGARATPDGRTSFEK